MHNVPSCNISAVLRDLGRSTADAIILLRNKVDYQHEEPDLADAILLNAALHLEGRMPEFRTTERCRGPFTVVRDGLWKWKIANRFEDERLGYTDKVTADEACRVMNLWTNEA